MCQEQLGLARAFPSFSQHLISRADADLHVAVTSPDVLLSTTQSGMFNTTTTAEFAPPCFEMKRFPCTEDADCALSHGEAWECKPSPYESGEHNLNWSINSRCVFRCGSDEDCCMHFGAAPGTSNDVSGECAHECRYVSETGPAGCLPLAETAACSAVSPAVLTSDSLELFACISKPSHGLSESSALSHQGMRAAWRALDASGPNSNQAEAFLRDGAFLLILFVSRNDDASVHEDFASPAYLCESDADCEQGVGRCEPDSRLSEVKGSQLSTCKGVVSHWYYDVASLLGDYQGAEHHECAYDLDCTDCSDNGDCDYGWHCQGDQKCRPEFFSFHHESSYQTPGGAPFHCLAPVKEYRGRLQALKDPGWRVLVASVVGDGVPLPVSDDSLEPDAPSLISNACLLDDRLENCVKYSQIGEAAHSICSAAPDGVGCEEYGAAKRDCIRDCYLLSLGTSKGPFDGNNPYVCDGEAGSARLGARYLALAELFGDDGHAWSICSPSGFTGILDELASWLELRTVAYCLPWPPGASDALEVWVEEEGKTSRMASNTDAYEIMTGVEACCLANPKGECTGSLTMLRLREALPPGASLRVSYVHL